MNSFERVKCWGYVTSVIAAFVLGIIATQFFNKVIEFGSRHYDPKNPGGLVLSRRLAYEATPMLDAIAAYRKEHGRAPTLEELKASPLLSPAYKSIYLNDNTQWYYLDENGGRSFGIRVKLGWDPDLWYDSETNHWEYVPGDGTASTDIDA